ncbi:MAG: chitobiase/beta-hexosaminidase C-terminal domain-containing protein, partial [Vicinamibacterales bacterium]
MWGANASGQVGDGTTTTRTRPTAISGPTSISNLALGDLHSVAATTEGDVWGWGEAGSGQVGDNGTTDRSSPVSVIADIPLWAPAAPTLNLASGTLAAPQTVTIGPSIAGATVHYALSGSDPTAADPEVPATGEVE